MTTFSKQIERAIRKYEPIETEGFTLYPITVNDWDLFSMSRPAIEVMQQTLPVRFVSMPLLQAYYTMDYEAITRGTKPIGFFSNALLFLALSLRLRLGDEDIQSTLNRFQISVYEDAPERLKCVYFTQDGEIRQSITPVQFARLRPIIAAQNGIQLVSEDANPDLVEAEKDLSSARGETLSGDVNELISGIAALSGTEEAEICEWPIKKMLDRRDALMRIMGYLACSIGSASGMVKWKNGNPYPHPFFSRVDGTSGLISLDSFAGGAGKKAIAEAAEQQN